MSEPLDTRLRKLAEERAEADRRYNEALTALDGARPGSPALPDPLLPLDEARLAELNAAWNILPDAPATAGFRGRLAGFIWRIVAPYLQRQLTFNSALVDHLNRTTEAVKAAHRRDLESIATSRALADSVADLHGHLMRYLQQITAYVDTKDRDTAGATLVLNAALSDLAEAQGKYRESLAAREHRYEARTTAISAAHEELRGMIGVLQHAVTSIRRHVETSAPAAATVATNQPSPQPVAAGAFAPSLDAYKYLGFEDQFRGSRSVIRERQQSYLPYFAQADPSSRRDVLDVGCGRGEFIELLNANGIPARGIDLNHEMVESCRARGLQVERADAVPYLEAQPEASLRGLFAAQVVEHFEPAYLLRFLDLAYSRLEPGGTLVLETLNPACWTAFFESYIRDITHKWPLHPETLKYLVLASGFTHADIELRSPVPPQDRLQPITAPPSADPGLLAHVDAFNGNVEKLNARMFSHMDYAIVARKGHRTPAAGDSAQE